MEFIRYGSTTMLGNATKTFQFWDKDLQNDERLSNSTSLILLLLFLDASIDDFGESEQTLMSLHSNNIISVLLIWGKQA
ncbi:hypothetical protein LINPERPRIM_LOCUS16296 [Linum perenne]